jgi:hypothetical protein
MTDVTFTIELEREEDGRWIAEVPALPGVQALALRVIAERLENREAPAECVNVPGGVSPDRSLFVSEGKTIIHPEPARFFEVPIRGPLPEALNDMP